MFVVLDYFEEDYLNDLDNIIVVINMINNITIKNFIERLNECIYRVFANIDDVIHRANIYLSEGPL